MLSHNVVKDLLPEYIDGLCSEETNAEILEHLENCADCNAVYAAMKGEPLPISEAADSGNNLNYLGKIRKRNMRIVLIAVSAVVVLVLVFLKIFVIGTRLYSDDVIFSYGKSDSEFHEIAFAYTGKGELAIRPSTFDLSYIKTPNVEHGSKRVVTLDVRVVPPLFGMGNAYTFKVDRKYINSVFEEYEVVVRFADKDTIIEEYTSPRGYVTVSPDIGSAEDGGNTIVIPGYDYGFSVDERERGLIFFDYFTVLFISIFLGVATLLCTIFGILIVINDNLTPRQKLLWILFIVFVQIIGAIVYFIWCGKRHRHDTFKPW
jgi:heme/copper-type cytochrome/quinol oxidase subunit 4